MKFQHHLLSLTLLITMTAGATRAADAQSVTSSINPTQNTPNRQIAFISPSPDLVKLRDAAQSNYQALQFQTAIDLYRRACQFPAADAGDFYWLGESYFHTRQYSNASQSFSRALTLNPAGDNLRVRLVESLIAAKQPDQAKSACAEALSLAKNDYARKQLSVLSKVTDMSNIKPPKPANAGSRANHMEQ